MKYLTGCILALVLASCSGNKDRVRPVRKEIVQVVYASGKVFPLNHVSIAAKVPAYVQQVLVKEGAAVAAGMPLVLLSNPNSEVNVSIARANVDLTEQLNRTDANQLHAAYQDVQTAYARYRLDSTNLVRYQNLWDQEITTRANLDAARTQAEVALQHYRRSLDVYRNLKTKSGSDLSIARRQLELQQNNKSDYLIKAPVAGRVYSVAVKEGQLLTTGMQAIEIGDTSRFEAELEVDESDIGMIRPGQQVVLNAEAYDGQPVYTTVREIEPSVIAGTKTVKIRADLAPGSWQLLSGMSVEANIIIATKKHALVIPSEYLAAGNKVVLKKGKKQVAVTTGIRDVQYVEILSGITENTEIIKP